MSVEQFPPELVEATRWVWPCLKEAFTESLQRSLKEQRRLHLRLPERELDRINRKMTRLNEQTLASLEQDPEAQKLLPLYASQPTACLEQLLPLFVQYLRQHVLAEVEQDKMAGHLSSREYADDLSRALDLGEKQAKQQIEEQFKPHRAVREALEQGRYEAAVEIIRGQLALEPHDIEMVNHLATVGCLSSRVSLILEARAKAEEVSSDQKVITHPNPWPMAQFLQANVVEGIVVGISPLTAGGIVLPSGLSQSGQKEWLEISSTIIEWSAGEVAKRLLDIAEWTEESFLIMCREVVSEQCCRYQRWKPGAFIMPQFKGQKLPERFRGKIQFINPNQL